ncbi:hypothetical protein E2320_003542, partial [Naja naja]
LDTKICPATSFNVLCLDEINKNVKLFPNITLALEIYETSFNAWQTNKNILDFLFLNRRSPVNFNCGRRREMDFLPIIGDLISLNSIQMAHILNIYKFPQVPPHARCVESCCQGYSRLVQEGKHTCCYNCTQYLEGRISVEMGKVKSVPCHPGEPVPNE